MDEMKPFHIRLTGDDIARIALIRQAQGCLSDAAAIRSALITGASVARAQLAKEARKKSSVAS